MTVLIENHFEEKLSILCVLCVLNERSEWAVDMAFLYNARAWAANLANPDMPKSLIWVVECQVRSVPASSLFVSLQDPVDCEHLGGAHSLL